MVRTNKLQQAPPYDVEQCINRLGENLRIARIRRSLTIEDVAERIGTGPRAVMDAEKGKPATGLVVYAALLWLYDQLHQLEAVAEPTKDEQGLSLQMARERTRVRKKKGLESDF
jgi:transcriptional regulator with XRE-family HTH domain